MNADPNVVVRAVLSQPAYDLSARPGVDDGWVPVLFALLRRLLEPLFRALRTHGQNVEQTSTIAGVVLLVLALAGFGFAVYLLAVRNARARGGRYRSLLRTNGAGKRESAHTLLGKAIEASRAGRLREASAMLYLACLIALDELGRIAYAPSRTVGEYIRLVGTRAPEFREPVAQSGTLFTRAIFADETPAPSAFERALTIAGTSALFADRVA